MARIESVRRVGIQGFLGNVDMGKRERGERVTDDDGFLGKFT